MLRVVFLCSGRGDLARSVVDECESDSRIAFAGLVGDEHADGAIAFGALVGMPVRRLVRAEHPSVAGFNCALYDQLDNWEPDLVVCTFNHLLTEPILSRWHHRVINVHYSLLPSFPGFKAIPRALAYGVLFAGVTIHYVDDSVDEGPPIVQAVAPLETNDTQHSLQDRLFHLASPMLLQVVDWIASDRVRVADEEAGRRVIVARASYGTLPVNPFPERYADRVYLGHGDGATRPAP